MPRRRPAGDHLRAARILLVLGALLAVVALLLTGLRLAVLDEGRFAAAAGKAVATPQVSDLLGERISDRLVRAEPDLVTVQPLVRTGVTAAVRSGAARGLVRTAARQLHRTAVDGDADTAVLRLGNVGLLAVQSLRSLSPDVAAKIPKDVDRTLVSLEAGQGADVVGSVTEAADAVRWASWIASVLAVAVLGAAVLVRRDRVAALRRAGFAVAAAGVGTIVVHFAIRAALVDAVTSHDTRAAGFAVHDAFLGGTVTLGIATVAVGLVAVAGIGALTRRESLTALARRRLISVDTDPRGRRALAGAVALAGALLLADRDLAARVLATVGGIVLLVAGLEGLLRSTDRAAGEEHAAAEIAPTAAAEPDDQHGPRDAPRPATGGGAARRRRGLPVRRGIAVGAVVVLGLVVVGGTTEHSLEASATPPTRCEGSAALCGLRLDQVALPATHNAYSSARDGFLLANQQTGVADQLEGGIRGFLIDTYEAQPTDRGVYTRLDRSPNSREKVESSIGPDATRTALRLRGQLGRTRGPVDVYLCHGFCELGAVKAVDVLRQVRDFLLSHPDEIVVFSVEDQVAPRRFAEVVRQSGLLDLVWKGRVSPPPTLGEMVRSGGRVLFLAEEDAGDVPWLHQQFELAQETPYDLTSAKALLGDPGCAAGRGGTTPPLLLLNHFLGTVPPRPSAATAVNARSAILEQVARCRKLRGRTANLLAVDFWRTGDVVGAARQLNEQAVHGTG